MTKNSGIPVSQNLALFESSYQLSQFFNSP
jgi:hypothetical protein